MSTLPAVTLLETMVALQRAGLQARAAVGSPPLKVQM